MWVTLIIISVFLMATSISFIQKDTSNNGNYWVFNSLFSTLFSLLFTGLIVMAALTLNDRYHAKLTLMGGTPSLEARYTDNIDGTRSIEYFHKRNSND